MVGVPLSRGCEGCRKQKKRCEGSSAPCVRCRRLDLDCIGFGEKRFKFQDENTRFLPVTAKPQGGEEVLVLTSKDSDPTPTRKSGKPRRIAVDGEARPGWAVTREWTTSLAAVPSNSLTRIVNRFTSNLDSGQDSSYQLPWNFGPFLEDVPRHLGHNAALDSAAEALMTSYMAFRTRNRVNLSTNDALCVKSYGKAIKSLRECLNDQRASSSETLCSTMILLIVETLSGLGRERMLAHAGGAASILKARGAIKARNAFEDQILLSLRGPVIMHAMLSPEPLFTDQEWEELILNPIEGSGVDGRTMKTFALFPNLLLTARSVFSQDLVDYEKLAAVHAKLEALYAIHTKDTQEVVARFEELDTRQSDVGGLPVSLLILHSHFARQVAITIAVEAMICVLLSTICSALPPTAISSSGHVSTTVPDLKTQSSAPDPSVYLSQAAKGSAYLSDLADKVIRHRPLGTIYLTWVLRIAYVTASSEEAKSRVYRQLLDYAQDMAGLSVKLDSGELDALGDYLSLRDVIGG